MPLFKFNPIESALDELKTIAPPLKKRLIIITSPQIIPLLKQFNVKLDTNSLYYSVGEGSVQLFIEQFKMPINFPQQQNSTGLLTLLDAEISNFTDIDVLILQGNVSRNLLAQELKKRKANVHVQVLYHREVIDYSNIKENFFRQERAHNNEINIFIVTSFEHLNQLNHWTDSEIKENSWIIISHESFKDEAHKSGWMHVHIVGSANNQQLLDGINFLKTNSLE